jgi:pimeloyl-ACP methyl ester carboxylesterase
VELQQEVVTANDVEFAYLTAGPGDGPLALCLHGFPDSAHTWRRLAPALVDAGHRVVAPFLRGYAPTAVPADGAYQTGALAKDAFALHEVLGGDERAVVIGHDWGAAATYGAASLAPDRWRRVVTAAVPPSGAVGKGFLTYDQLQRSWYMFFFQHPLADIVTGQDDLEFVDRLWADWSPGYDAAEDLALLKPSLREPANLAAGPRVLPGDARRHTPRSLARSRAGGHAAADATAHALPPRRRRRLHRGEHRRGVRGVPR